MTPLTASGAGLSVSHGQAILRGTPTQVAKAHGSGTLADSGGAMLLQRVVPALTGVAPYERRATT